MIVTTCLECKARIKICNNPEIGQRICCPNCKTELEVIWLYPLSLDYLDENILDVAVEQPASGPHATTTEV